MEEKEADPPGEKECAEVVIEEPADRQKADDIRCQHAKDIVFILKLDQFISGEIGNHFWVDWSGAEKHPKNVGVEKSLFDRIGVLVSIDKGVVEAVVVAPSESAPLCCDAGKKEENRLNNGVSFIAAVGVESMIACRDRDPGYENKARRDEN
jgi:hypothetical protein